MDLTLEDLTLLEKNLKQCADLLSEKNEKDRRVLYAWSEYYVALRIKQQHPDWGVKVRGWAINSADVVCQRGDGASVLVQVKTGMWKKYKFGSDAFCSADASFGKGTQISGRKFHYLVFLTTIFTEVIDTLIFSIRELNQIGARPGMAQNSEGNSWFLSRADSIEKWERWLKFKNINEPIYDVERDIAENPFSYKDRWDKIM